MPSNGDHPGNTARAPGPDAGPHFDATVDEVWTDADGLLRRLRIDDPVHWSEPEQAWVLTRHADALEVLRGDRTFSADGRGGIGRAGELVRGVAAQSPLPYDSILSSAGHADHARLRRAAAAAFAPASVEALRAPIRTLATALIEAARGDELETMNQFAQPLSLGITLQLLGIDTLPAGNVEIRRQAALLVRLAQLLMTASQFGPAALSDRPDVDLADACAGIGELIEAFDIDGDSLLASLRADRDAGTLSGDDLVALVVFVATVGQAPTAFAIGNALLALLRNPDQFAALRADPALLANVIDESARFDPALRVIRRFATVDTEFRGRQLHAGDQLQIIIIAVKRDPAVFPDPNRFDLRRGARNHLGFGWGSHHCLGAPVARAIAEESLPLLLEAFPNLTASGRLELLAGETAGPTVLGIVGRPGIERARLEAGDGANVVHRSVAEVPANHACPCGSGRKYKRCHGRGR